MPARPSSPAAAPSTEQRAIRSVAAARANVDQADEEAGRGAVTRGVVEGHGPGGPGEAGGADAAEDVAGVVAPPCGDAKGGGPDGVVGEGVVGAAGRAEAGRWEVDEGVVDEGRVDRGEDGLEGRAAGAVEGVQAAGCGGARRGAACIRMIARVCGCGNFGACSGVWTICISLMMFLNWTFVELPVNSNARRG